MIGRSKNWIGPSDFIQEFNKKHNPDYYYGKNTQKKKTKKKKKTRRTLRSQTISRIQSIGLNGCDIISDSGWADDKQFNRMKLAYPVNEGWLFSKDKNHIKVFASYDKDEDTKEITFGDRTMIPVSCVKKIIKLN